MAQPRIIFKAHRKLSSALFSHLQAAQTWSLGELSCTCTDLAKRHPSLPKHEGHLLFSGSDTHELFDPDTVSMLSGSMRNSFFPPRGVLMNRLTQAFHHWARANNLPSLDPSTLSTIVDFHFDLHPWSFVPCRFLALGPEKRGLRSKNCTAKSIKSL